MTRPRSTQVSLEITSYYHCMSRCVRQAFLCGYDRKTKKNYKHRQVKIENKILDLSKHFCITVPAYAVMSNHYHVILHVDKEKALSLSDMDVAKRWLKICKKDDLIKLFVDKEKLKAGQKKSIEKRLAVIRERLYSISWFMRIINQSIATLCNKEEKITGAFWSSRFKSIALENEAAILACMAYVDLNPIRAKITKSLETSNHTSIKHRIDKKQALEKPIIYIGQDQEDETPDIKIKLEEYFELIKWTAININKETLDDDAESKKMMDFLRKKSIPMDYWLIACDNFEYLFTRSADGTISPLKLMNLYGIKRDYKTQANKKT